jgi:hypothetical protein
MNNKKILMFFAFITFLYAKNTFSQDSVSTNKIIDQINYGFDNILVVRIKNVKSKEVHELALPNHVLYSIYEQNSFKPSEKKYVDMIKNLLFNKSEYSVSSLNKRIIKKYKISVFYYNKLNVIELDSLINKYFDENNLIKSNQKDEINALIKVLFEHGIFVSINCLNSYYELHNIEKND